MITDNIKNISLYSGIGGRITKALKYLSENDFSGMKPGDYEIEGKNIYMLVRHYESKSEENCSWEAHKKYIDVQFVCEGEEYMGYSRLERMRISGEYNEVKDKLTLEGEGDFFKISKNNFVILFPEDAHKPGVTLHEPKNVKKIVIKALI